LVRHNRTYSAGTAGVIRESGFHGSVLAILQSLRPWTTSLTNKDRDVSFEVSNLGASKSEFYSPKSGLLLVIDKVVFSQRAKALRSLLNFNAVSIASSPMVMSMTSQRGVLGVGNRKEGEEDGV
jgi:hypothetical protein